MTNHIVLLETLEQDALPDVLRMRFLRWCVLEQARPALVALLAQTSLVRAGAALKQVNRLSTLAEMTAAIKNRAGDLAGHGKAGTAAIAALFEFDNLVRVTLEPVPDTSAAAFFAARVCGWQALVHEGKHYPTRKREAELRARRAQETVLRYLLEGYAQSS